MTETETSYDSTQDTRAHIRRVRELLTIVMKELEYRKTTHDWSKLLPPEKPLFDEYTPKLASLSYTDADGNVSQAYRDALAGLRPALDHHYATHRHHPEWHTNGVADMNLVDLLEMLCDWIAASERHSNGDVEKSLVANERRFGIDPALMRAFRNTVRDFEF